MKPTAPSGRGQEATAQIPTLNQAQHLMPTSSWRCTNPQERARLVWSLKTNCHKVLEEKKSIYFLTCSLLPSKFWYSLQRGRDKETPYPGLRMLHPDMEKHRCTVPLTSWLPCWRLERPDRLTNCLWGQQTPDKKPPWLTWHCCSTQCSSQLFKRSFLKSFSHKGRWACSVCHGRTEKPERWRNRLLKNKQFCYYDNT